MFSKQGLARYTFIHPGKDKDPVMNADNAGNWHDVETQAVSLIDKGILLRGLGQNKAALASFDKAVTICRPISDEADPMARVLSQALDNKARALMDLERVAEAIPCLNEAIQVHEGIVRGDGTEQDVREIAISVMNKGLALMRLGRSEEALACFEQALDGFRRCESDEDAARALLNCGELYIRQGRLAEALAAYDESLAGWEAVSSDEPDDAMADHAYALYGKADVLHRVERYGEALDLSDRSIALHRAVVKHANGPRERNTLAEAVNLRGHILTRLGRTKEAQESFHEAAKLKGKTNSVDGDTSREDEQRDEDRQDT
jgi:tetratricopeptide (TPR) repeat protein